jgi:hypothetical protein
MAQRNINKYNFCEAEAQIMIGIHIFKIEEEMSVGNLMKFSK